MVCSSALFTVLGGPVTRLHSFFALATALLALSAGGADERPRIEADGTVHVPAFDLPETAYFSVESRAAMKRFREVYEQSPHLVEELFTQDETGLGMVLQDALDNMTRDFDGLLARKDELLSDQKDLLNQRIDSMNVLLGAKRARLEAQFVGLESSLAGLQSQQNALGILAQLASQV